MRWTARAVMIVGLLALLLGGAIFRAAEAERETSQQIADRALCRLAEAALQRPPNSPPCPPLPRAADPEGQREGMLFALGGAALLLLGAGLALDSRGRR